MSTSTFDTRPWLDPDAKPFLQVKGLTKRFGDVTAVAGVDLAIFRGEFFAILGGSGCGKTMLLRMLAGFETPDAGRVVIDGIDVTDMAPHRRPVNLMFQSYALFPHMNVRKNVAYGLRRAGLAVNEVDERVREMLELVQLGDLAERRPQQLSGGQRQRVALARALVKKPKVLLLDEPLAALDKKLRERTQFELARIHEDLGITFVVVTHDQDEAMTLATRIAVMDAGRFRQIGTPQEVYEYPNSRMVADFIGTINQFEARVESVAGNEARVRAVGVTEPWTVTPHNLVAAGDRVVVAVRPEKMRMARTPPEEHGRTTIRGVVLDLAYFGSRSLYQVQTGDGRVVLVSAENRQRSAEFALGWDEEVYVSWDDESAVVLSE